MNDSVKPRTRSYSVTSLTKYPREQINEMTKNRGKNSSADTDNACTEDKLDIILQRVTIANNGVQSLNDKFDNLAEEFKQLKENTHKNTERLQSAEIRLDSIEQYSKRNNLRFFGIPEVPNENTMEVVLKVINEKMNVRLSGEDLEGAYRIGANNNDAPKAIFLKMVSHKYKQEVYRQRTKLAGSKITVREDLTKERMKVLKLAIEKFGRKNVWTLDGRIKWMENGGKFTATRIGQLERS